MNTFIFELLLKNSDNGLSYLIDIFQENTIKSQDVIIDIIDDYRSKFKDIDKKKYILVFRKVNELNEGGVSEKIVKIKDSSIFYIDGDKNVSFDDSELVDRSLIIEDTINFKI